MRHLIVFGLLLPLTAVLSCGGKVVVERDGNEAGAAGFSDTGENGGGFSCGDVECESDSSSCSCRTNCSGPELRTDCKLSDGKTVICECHFDDAYMGTCGQIGGSLCGLPDGCCLGYLPD